MRFFLKWSLCCSLLIVGCKTLDVSDTVRPINVRVTVNCDGTQTVKDKETEDASSESKGRISLGIEGKGLQEEVRCPETRSRDKSPPE